MSTRQNASLPRVLLTRLPLDVDWQAAMADRYRIIAWDQAVACDRATALAVVTNGSMGLNAAELAALPKVELIASFGAGYETIDLSAAQQRGVCVCHAPGVNAQVVADHALALMLALARGIPALDRGVKAGVWASLRTPPPSVVRGKTLGIVGLGNIGQRLAQLGAAIGMRIAYLRHNRIHDDYTPYADVTALAAACDVLALTCPGGPNTYHTVNAAVLQALGSAGFLINVARGTVVDTEALVHALAHGVIAGAALDVWEGEPEIPAALRGMDQVILTPHLAGRSSETRRAQHDILARNLDGWFAQGRPVHRVGFSV